MPTPISMASLLRQERSRHVVDGHRDSDRRRDCEDLPAQRDAGSEDRDRDREAGEHGDAAEPRRRLTVEVAIPVRLGDRPGPAREPHRGWYRRGADGAPPPGTAAAPSAMASLRRSRGDGVPIREREAPAERTAALAYLGAGFVASSFLGLVFHQEIRIVVQNLRISY